MPETQTEHVSAKVHLGRVIRRIRKDHRLNQNELANRMGIPRDTLGRFERGDRVPRPTEWVQLHTALQPTHSEHLELHEHILTVLIGTPAV